MYTAAGIAGVTETNLEKVNAAIADAVSQSTDTLTDQQIKKIAAVAVIGAHADADSDNQPSVDVYTAAGIAGVTETNLEKVNAAIARVNNPDGLTEQQIKKIAAVAIIEAYADGSSEDAPSRQNYLDAGFDSIKTDDDVAAINAVIAGTASDTVGQEADGALSEDQINQLVGLAMIKAYTADASLTDLTPNDYAAVEINDVTQANIEEVNAAIANTDIDEIVAVASQAVIQADALAIIEAYADSGGDGSQQVPSVSDYTAAGIDDVTDTNLNNVNTAIADADSGGALTKEQINSIAADAVREAYEADASRVGLQGSQIFIDSNENFTQDDNEATTATTSNENGFFTLDSVDENSVIVAIGGTDIISGNELGDLLLAGFGREDEPFSITPISTLLVNAESEESPNTEKLLAALGLEVDTSINDIVTSDPYIEDQDGSATTDDLLRTNQQLLNLMLTASSLTDDDNGTEEGSAIDTNAALADTLLDFADTNESIDLADAEVLQSIISDIATESGLTISSAAINAIASRLATLNFILTDESIDPTDDVAVAAISAAQDELQDAIQQLSTGGLNVEAFEADTEVATLFGGLTSFEDLPNSDDDDLPDVIDDDDDGDGYLDRDELFDLDATRAGTIAIDGSAHLNTGPKEHETLQVVVQGDNIDADKLSYQWYRVDNNFGVTPITNEQSDTYRLSSADVGFRIKVRVTYSDDSVLNGHSDSVDSNLTAFVVQNNAPFATSSTLEVNEQELAVINLSGTDPDGTTVSLFKITSLPTQGLLKDVNGGDTVAIDETIALPHTVAGSLTYTSTSDTAIADSFEFKVNDGYLDSDDTATLSITIKPINDAPTATDQGITVNEQTSSSFALEGADADMVEGVSLSFNITSLPTNGTLSDDNGDIATATVESPHNVQGTLKYISTSDTAITDSFRFKANDGSLDSNNEAIVNIAITPVDDLPIASNQLVEIAEQTAISITLQGTDADIPEGVNLSFKITSLPNNGTLSDDNEEIANATIASPYAVLGSLAYISTSDIATADSFSFIASDGNLDSSNTAELSITIIPVNDEPVANDQDVTVDEQVQSGITLEASDVDNASESIAYIITNLPSNGFLKDDGALVNVQHNVSGNLTYTSTLQVDGSDSFQFKADDGESDSASATVSITINNVNANVNLATMTSDVGLRIDGVSADDNSGWSVSDAGDVDGDGVSDVIIGMDKTHDGKAYLVYGADSTDNDPIDLNDRASGRFKTLSNVGGKVVSAAGDFNGDGYDDVIIGERNGTPTDIDDPSREDAGISHVRFGGPRDITSTKMSIYGATQHSNIGASVSGAGDINGDGYADIIVGGRDHDNKPGAYIIYGGKAIHDIDLANFNSSLGFSIDGVPADGQDQDYRVSSAGDVDGDGYDDVLITGKYIYILWRCQ